MAKMFYTMDETKAKLGRREEDILALAREGRLREFRDGSRLMFKADQVDALRDEFVKPYVDSLPIVNSVDIQPEPEPEPGIEICLPQGDTSTERLAELTSIVRGIEKLLKQEKQVSKTERKSNWIPKPSFLSTLGKTAIIYMIGVVVGFCICFFLRG